MTCGLLLSGPPGAGKSTVAREVAGRLGHQFIDLDELIEARSGKTPALILEQDGEPRFRALEAEALEALDGATGAIVALGGGALTTERGRALARRLGPVIQLDVGLEELEKRLRADSMSRPLLADGLEQLLAGRADTYAAIDGAVDGLGEPAEVANRVLSFSRDWSVVLSRFGSDETRILIGRHLTSAITGAVRHLGPKRPVLLILDEGVPADVRQHIASALADAYPTHVISAVGGERTKTWTFLGEVLDQALTHGCGRQSVVVGVGGGAVCDLSNLAASLLGRGARSVLVPTTLLAQVDASVGGKCAVNVAGQRNSVGAFHPPHEVITDIELLNSLDPAEYRSGLAELIKMAILGDTELFERLENGEKVGPDMIARAVDLKARIVARDPTERGERRTLNLGHTLGHALEGASNFGLRHGEAVAMGMVAAAWASVRKGYASADTARRIEALLEKLELPRRPEKVLLEQARDHIAADKKSDSQACDWIAIRELGEVMTERLGLAELKRTLVELEG